MQCDVCMRYADDTIYQITVGPNGPIVWKSVLCAKCLKATTKAIAKDGEVAYASREEAVAASLFRFGSVTNA